MDESFKKPKREKPELSSMEFTPDGKIEIDIDILDGISNETREIIKNPDFYIIRADVLLSKKNEDEIKEYFNDTLRELEKVDEKCREKLNHLGHEKFKINNAEHLRAFDREKLTQKNKTQIEQMNKIFLDTSKLIEYIEIRLGTYKP